MKLICQRKLTSIQTQSSQQRYLSFYLSPFTSTRLQKLSWKNTFISTPDTTPIIPPSSRHTPNPANWIRLWVVKLLQPNLLNSTPDGYPPLQLQKAIMMQLQRVPTAPLTRARRVMPYQSYCLDFKGLYLETKYKTVEDMTPNVMAAAGLRDRSAEHPTAMPPLNELNIMQNGQSFAPIQQESMKVVIVPVARASQVLLQAKDWRQVAAQAQLKLDMKTQVAPTPTKPKIYPRILATALEWLAELSLLIMELRTRLTTPEQRKTEKVFPVSQTPKTNVMMVSFRLKKMTFKIVWPKNQIVPSLPSVLLIVIMELKAQKQAFPIELTFRSIV